MSLFESNLKISLTTFIQDQILKMKLVKLEKSQIIVIFFRIFDCLRSSEHLKDLSSAFFKNNLQFASTGVSLFALSERNIFIGLSNLLSLCIIC